MRIENQPYGRMNEIIYQHAFTVHPYKHPVIGSMVDLEAATIDDVRDVLPHLLRPRQPPRWSSPATSTPQQAIDLVNRYFGRVPKAENAVPRDIPKRARADEREARDGGRSVAAARGRRGSSHHLRRPPRFLSAAHRLEGGVGRTELAHLPQARVPDRPRVDRVRRRQPDREPESRSTPSRSSTRDRPPPRSRRRSSPSSIG